MGSCCSCCGGEGGESEVAPKSIDEREHMSPIEHRKIRDVLWLIIFLCAIGGSAYVSRQAVREGDLDVLRFGISSQSTLCSHGTEKSYDKLVFCFNGTSKLDTFRVCAPSCPKTEKDLINLYKVKSSEFVNNSGIADAAWKANDYELVRKLCVSPSISVLNRCLLDTTVTNSTALGLLFSGSKDPADSSLASSAQMFMNAYHDIQVTWYVILACGLGGGIILAFIFLQFLRCLATPIVWLSLLLFFAGLVVVDYLLAGKAGIASGIGVHAPTGEGSGHFGTPKVEEQYQQYYKILFWIFIGISVAFVLVVMFMFHRIQLSIALIHEAADVIRAMPQLILTPFIPVLLVGGVFMYGIFIAAFLASCGTIENGQLVWDRTLRRLMIYHVFFCLWVFYFLSGLHSVVMAGAVAAYYWIRDKHTLQSPVSHSIFRSVRYHVGSVAFGSLVLATVKLLRWYLMHMSKRLKRLSGNNQIIKVVLCCFHVCMWCFEKFIKFLTKNAYIMIAVDGHSFCKAAEQGWSLVMSNLLRMTALHMVTSYVLFMAKIGVGFICAVGTTVWIEKVLVFDSTSDTVSSPFAPSICTFILGYFVAYLFFEVVEFTIDTTMLCFCLDDMRNSSTGNYYASVRLLKFMAHAPKMSHDDHPH
eukprot:c8429_g1_i2.p1 GENE.c8429_g1_i2~~c8429_g1_i2.p1  ORF type:complete len:643 (-),score=98.17 c8429_g1_i2:75-2003(-)